MGSEEGQMLSAAAPPLDDDNLLSEILLRLPPQPSSLPRASAVCKRWLSIVSDRGFIRRFRLRHRRNPPLLSLVRRNPPLLGIHFVPTMESPNRVPHVSFSSPIDDGDRGFRLLGCRHGLVLIFHSSRDQILVWDPVTGDQHRTATPPEFDPFDGTVIRAAGDAHHFQVVLVDYKLGPDPRAVVSFYSSETAVWSILISTPLPGAMEYAGLPVMPAVLVGDSLYLLFSGNSRVILEANLDRQSIAVTAVPMDMFAEAPHCDNLIVMPAEGGLGILSLSGFTAHLWKRHTNCDGTASWLLRRNIDLDTLLHLNSQKTTYQYIAMFAYAEENNVAFWRTWSGTFMVQLESLKFSKIFEGIPGLISYPFESVYVAGAGIGGEHDGAEQEMLV